MTKLLDDAFALALQLSDDEQDQLALRIIAELTGDDEFDRTISATAHKLDKLVDEALEEDDAGLTQEIAAITEALTEYRRDGATLRPHEGVMERLEMKIRATTDDANPLA